MLSYSKYLFKLYNKSDFTIHVNTRHSSSRRLGRVGHYYLLPVKDFCEEDCKFVSFKFSVI